MAAICALRITCKPHEALQNIAALHIIYLAIEALPVPFSKHVPSASLMMDLSRHANKRHASCVGYASSGFTMSILQSSQLKASKITQI